MVKEETVFLASESWLEMVSLGWEGYMSSEEWKLAAGQIRAGAMEKGETRDILKQITLTLKTNGQYSILY